MMQPMLQPTQELMLQQMPQSIVDGVFWYTKHVHYTLVWIFLWN
jgi:hypothetical protein